MEQAPPRAISWLTALARRVDRPLHLIVRGGAEILAPLNDAFARVTLFDTLVFMKTMKRQRAYVGNDGLVGWHANPTVEGAPLDMLFAENYEIRRRCVCDLIRAPIE
jgi:hypothetical protein